MRWISDKYVIICQQTVNRSRNEASANMDNIVIEFEFRGKSMGMVDFEPHTFGNTADDLTIANAFNTLIMTFAPYEDGDPWNWIIKVDGAIMTPDTWHGKLLKDVKRISILGVGEASDTEPAHVIVELRRHSDRSCCQRQSSQRRNKKDYPPHVNTTAAIAAVMESLRVFLSFILSPP